MMLKKIQIVLKNKGWELIFLFLPTEQKSYIKRIILLEKTQDGKVRCYFASPFLVLLYSTTFLYILPAPPQIAGPFHL